MSIKSKVTQNTLKVIEKISGTKLSFGKLLWAIRASEESSQANFAEKLGITKQHLCDIEHGRKQVSPKLAATYADILGYSKEQFIRLSLQDMVDRQGLKVVVDISYKSRSGHHGTYAFGH